MSLKRICTLVFFVLFVINVSARHNFKIMFYNVENYFDCVDDPYTNDDDFTPSGNKYWNEKRFIAKRNNIASVIDSISKGRYHDIIGLCEVENREVLLQLINETSLNTEGYNILHRDSPDSRGIDVALLYKKDSFKPLHTEFYPITDSFKTREILYVRGCTSQNDTLHLFVNHWPSKFGGDIKTQPKRVTAAEKLKSITDSIFEKLKNPNICIMGDFNDFIDSEPIKKLNLNSNFDTINGNRLYNMSLHLYENMEGSSVYKNKWQLVDLFFVSGNLLDTNNKVYTKRENVSVFNNKFLLEQRADKGYRPFRSYMGPIYKGGYSDHLPIEIVLEVR